MKEAVGKKKMFLIWSLTLVLFGVIVFVSLFSINKLFECKSIPTTSNKEVVEADGIEDAKAKYVEALYYTAAYKYQQNNPGKYIPKKATIIFRITPVPYMHFYYHCAPYNDPNNKIEYEDTLYTIDSEEDYNDFVALTNAYSGESYNKSFTYYHMAGDVTVPAEAYGVERFLSFYNYVQMTGTDLIYQGVRYKSLYSEVDLLNKEISYDVSLDKYEPQDSNIKVTDVKITVSLNDDISPKYQASINYFRGIFDGCGYTVKFNGTAYYKAPATGLDKVSLHVDEVDYLRSFSPFISYLSKKGEVKNLKLNYNNLIIFLSAGGWGNYNHSRVGGVVGCNQGKIYNCIVDSPHVSSNRYLENATFAPLVYCCCNGGTASYCLVEGDYTAKAVDDGDGIACCNFSIGETGLSNCVYAAKFTKSGYTAEIKAPSGNFSSNSKLYSTEKVNDDYQRLDTSVIGGKDVSDDESEWYYAKGSDGKPYDHPQLRLFMDWKEVTVKTDNGVIEDGGTISKNKKSTTIFIPRSAESVPPSSAAHFEESYTIKIYEQKIKVTSNMCHSMFKSVRKIVEKSKYNTYEYNVSCAKPEVKLTIQLRTEGNSKVESKTWTLDCGAYISFEATPFKKAGTYQTAHLKVNTEDFYVKPPSNDYCIEINDEDVQKLKKGQVHYTDDNDGRISITINIKKKTYNVSVKK